MRGSVAGGFAAGKIVLFALISVTPDCASPPEDNRIDAVYDKTTGRLSQLAYDSDGNGSPDSWSFVDGTRLLRVEVDKNEDGLVDRWEYYGPERQLEKVGLSRSNDGIVDSWLYEGPDGSVARIEISTRRDGVVDRTEFFEEGSIVRAEEDTDADGAVDKWETYAGGALTSAAFDVEGAGYPTRRLVYRRDGTLERVESGADARGAQAPR